MNFIATLDGQDFEKSEGVDIIELPQQEVDFVSDKEEFLYKNDLGYKILKWFHFLDLRKKV